MTDLTASTHHVFKANTVNEEDSESDRQSHSERNRATATLEEEEEEEEEEEGLFKADSERRGPRARPRS